MKLHTDNSSKAKIIAIDDSPIMLIFLEQFLGKRYEITTYNSTSAALQDLSEGMQVDCILTDFYLGNDLTGLEFIQKLKAIDPITPVMVLSGSCDMNQKIECLHNGAFDFVNKPFNPMELEARLQKALASSSASNYRYAV